MLHLINPPFHNIIQRMLNYMDSQGEISAPPVDMQALAEQLKVLAEPRRLLIFHLLMEGVQCNCELGDLLDMAPNLISHHLSVLRQARLIDARRDTSDARWIYYSVNQPALEALNHSFGAFFNLERIKPARPTCGR
jgi:ArsR family transcriptional regulator, arsenate/arsenite/antimonite-responsive transcriptional repressor